MGPVVNGLRAEPRGESIATGMPSCPFFPVFSFTSYQSWLPCIAHGEEVKDLMPYDLYTPLSSDIAQTWSCGLLRDEEVQAKSMVKKGKAERLAGSGCFHPMVYLWAKVYLTFTIVILLILEFTMDLMTIFGWGHGVEGEILLNCR